MGFLDYDVEIRKIICSTNAIESLNAHYRRAVRARGHFSTERAALKCLYLVTPLAGPTGRGQARWLARCVYDHRDHLRKTVPAPAARRSTATKPTVTPPTTKPARHRYPSPEAKTAPITWNQTSITRSGYSAPCPSASSPSEKPSRCPQMVPIHPQSRSTPRSPHGIEKPADLG